MEIWEDIEGFEGSYQISNYGNVKSLSRQRSKSQPHIITKEKLLKPGTNFRGVKTVVIINSGTKICRTVHRLVLNAFIPNPENKPCCNHKDCNPSNNHVNNLEWCTYKENTQHAMANKLMDWSNSRKGESHGRSKLTENDVKKIKEELINRKRIYQEIADDFNVSSAAIYLIDIGRNWTHLTI